MSENPELASKLADILDKHRANLTVRSARALETAIDRLAYEGLDHDVAALTKWLRERPVIDPRQLEIQLAPPQND